MNNRNPLDILPKIPEIEETSMETAYDKMTEEMNCNENVKKEIMLGKRVGLYRIKGNLGNGNFSQVKLAVHLLTKEEVAIKILDKTKLDAKTQKLLSREISSMEKLHHPNIIRLYEVIEDFRKLHIIMEYASGGELHSLIVNHGKIPEPISKLIFAQIIAAVNHLHSQNIIHRDLKAENIFFAGNKSETSQEDSQLNSDKKKLDFNDSTFSRLVHVKLGDFGFSTLAQKSEKLTTFCGSPPYAAPELFQADWYIGTCVDVWALGILLYFMLCGCMPFRGESVGLLKRLILSGNYVCPNWLPVEAKKLIQLILKLNPENRLTIQQIISHEWLSGQQFPSPYQPFKATPLIPEIETISQPENRCCESNPTLDLLEKDSIEASKMLLGLGITDKHIEIAQAQTVRNYVTGTYRIMLHRVHRNRRMSNIPQSMSNPELGRRFFSNRKYPTKGLLRNLNGGQRAKLSTNSDKSDEANKTSKMCNIL